MGINARIKWEIPQQFFKQHNIFFSKPSLVIWYPSLTKNKRKEFGHSSKPSKEIFAASPTLCWASLRPELVLKSTGSQARKGPQGRMKTLIICFSPQSSLSLLRVGIRGTGFIGMLSEENEEKPLPVLF